MMKKLELVVRILFGLLFLWASIAYFFNLMPQPELTGDMATLMAGFAASHYIFPVIKTIELLCGIAFVSGFFVPLATVIIFPISVNILLIHVFLSPKDLPIALFIMIVNLFLAYRHSSSYKGLFVTK
jgi:uncharacterized membrane protein YphA (DoxX/SURF4 family)